MKNLRKIFRRDVEVSSWAFRKQISSARLESLETVTKEVLLILSLGSPSRTPGSLFNQGWRIPHQLSISGLFFSHHPAFLPYILHFLDRLGLSQAERQSWWRGLGAERPQELQLEVHYSEPGAQPAAGRVPVHQFYRGGASSVVGGGVRLGEDGEAFYRFLGDLLPSITGFMAAFQPRSRGPPPSVDSQNTEVTESSGVSSLIPKTRGKQTAAAATPTENLKRKPFLEPEPARQTKKRQILKERN